MRINRSAAFGGPFESSIPVKQHYVGTDHEGIQDVERDYRV